MVVDAAQMSSLLSYSLLIPHLRQAFTHAEAIAAPPRHHHTIPLPSSSSSSSSPTLLLMPAWPLNPSPSSSYMGLKLVSVFPHNSLAGLPSVSASYLLSSALTGLPFALLDGKELTLWRTACVSALASQCLACPDAAVLLMVGAGALAPHLIKAHCVAHPSIQTVIVWNRTHSKAESLVQALQSEGWNTLACKTLYACTDLEKVAHVADIICCATLSEKPLVRGSWLRPGMHLDLVGSFTPGMKECDEDAIKKALVFVDTQAALEEAGELVGHVATVKGTLSELVRGEKQGRLNVQDITVFKSVGCALVDLATAQLVYERLHLTR